jgi:hypothetical protein
MRNFTDFSISGYEQRIYSIVRAETRRIKSLMHHVVDNPTFPAGETTFRVKNLKSKELFELALISWYLPEELGVLLRLDLESRTSKLSDEDKHKIPLMLVLSSKAETLLFLQETSLWSTQEFFGNYLLLGTFRKLQLLILSPKVVYPQRKRGYHDQGTRAFDSYYLKARAYWKDTELHLEMAKQKGSQGHCPDWVRTSLVAWFCTADKGSGL